jgi:purine-binding chemotaxis protein CheW
VINLRGQILAVIDLAERFGLGQHDKLSEKARIIVTEVQGQTVGMLVDEVPEVLKMPEENIEPTPELLRARLRKDYVKGVGRLGDWIIVLLDMEKVLALQETEEIARAETLETKV